MLQVDPQKPLRLFVREHRRRWLAEKQAADYAPVDGPKVDEIPIISLLFLHLPG